MTHSLFFDHFIIRALLWAHVVAFTPALNRRAVLLLHERSVDETAAKFGMAVLGHVIIRVAEQIVAKHVVEAVLPRFVGIAADVDAFDEFHLLLTWVLDIDIDV